MMKKKQLFVVYNVKGEFGFDRKKDKRIRNIMRKYKSTGSGSGFGQRDISYVMDEKDVPFVTNKLTKADFSVKIFDYE